MHPQLEKMYNLYKLLIERYSRLFARRLDNLVKKCISLTWRIFDEIDLGINSKWYCRDHRDRPGRKDEARWSFETAHRIYAQRVTDGQISLHRECHDREN